MDASTLSIGQVSFFSQYGHGIGKLDGLPYYIGALRSFMQSFLQHIFGRWYLVAILLLTTDCCVVASRKIATVM